MAYIVAYESRPVNTHCWVPNFRVFQTKRDAIEAYNATLSGEHGSFGPIEYRRLTIGTVLCEHEKIVAVEPEVTAEAKYNQ